MQDLQAEQSNVVRASARPGLSLALGAAGLLVVSLVCAAVAMQSGSDRAHGDLYHDTIHYGE